MKPGDRVEIIAGWPHENMHRIATLSYRQSDGDWVVYFGDQDEDEWVYSPHELRAFKPVSQNGISTRLYDVVDSYRDGSTRDLVEAIERAIQPEIQARRAMNMAGCAVHHINGDYRDNRPENLRLVKINENR